MLKRQHELDVRERELRHEREKLNLERELRHSENRLRALSDDAGSHMSSRRSDTAALVSIVRTLRKPSFQVEKFDGNPMKYRRFMRDFTTNVLQFCDSDSEKMASLTQYTTGEAKQVVLGFTHLSDSFAYSSAMKKMEQRFGDKELISQAYAQRALQWPPIKHNDAKGLEKYGTFLTEVYSATKELGDLGILKYPESLKQLVYKLPLGLHDKWLALVQRKKRDPEDSKVTLLDLVKFVDGESEKMNDTTFGRSARSQLHEKEKNAPKDKKIKAAAAATTNGKLCIFL